MKISKLRKITSSVLAAILLIVGIVPLLIPDSDVVADTALAEPTPEAVFDPSIWLECKDTNVVSASNGLESGTDKFAKQATLSVKSADYYSSVDRSFYIKVNFGAALDFSAIGDKGYIKLWVKTPKAASFNFILLHTSSYHYDVNIPLSTTSSADWQEIKIPIRDMGITCSTFDFKNLIGIKIKPSASADSFLAVGESMSFGQIEIYDEELPENNTNPTPELKLDPSIWLECKDTNIVSSSSSTTTDNPKFTKQSNLNVKSADFYGSVNRSFYIKVDWGAKLDLSAIGDKGYIKLWVKTPHATSFDFILLHTGGYHYCVDIPVATKDGTDWQELNIPIRDMEINCQTSDFDFKNLIGIKIRPSASADSFLAVGESMSFGQIEIYDEELPEEGVAKPEIKRDPSIWLECKDTNIVAASNNVASSNPNFKNQSNLTVKSADFYGSVNRSFYIALDWGANIDLSAIGDKGYIKLWVKTPHATSFDFILLHTNEYHYDVDIPISTNDSTDWQEIKIPISDMNITCATFDFKNLIGIKIRPSSSADTFLAVGESMSFGQIEIYDEELPKGEVDSNAPDFKADPNAWRDDKYSEYFKTGKSTVTDNDKFKTQSYATILKEEYYTKDRSFYILVDWNGGIDLSAIGDNGYMTLWVKTPHPATFTAQILYKNYQVAASFEITTAEGTGWQEIKVPRSKMNIGDPNFNFKELVGIKILPAASSDKFLKVNETIYFGQIEIYSKSLDGGQGGAEYVDLGEITPKKNYSVLFDAKVLNTGCSSSGISVGTNKANTSLFEHSMKVTLNDAESYFATASNMDFHTNWKKEINLADALEDGYIEMWIKTPYPLTLELVADAYWPTAKLKFTTAEGTDWQKVTLPMSSFVDGSEAMSYNNFVVLRFRSTNQAGFIKEGDSFEVGRITFFCPTADIGKSGANETYPIAENKLTKYDGTNFMLTKSTSGFWSAEYEVAKYPFSALKNEYGGIAKDDSNYNKFQNTMRVWLSDVDEYYKRGGNSFSVYIKKSANENGRTQNIDLNDYIKTGTLRAWFKVDSETTIRISMANGDAHKIPANPGTGEYGAFVNVTLKPTTENNGFVEVQIPLKKFYDKAVETNCPFRFDKLHGFSISPVNKTKEGFLDKDESLIYSSFEVWAKEAPEPQVLDTTKIFTCGNGNGITLIDKNEIMPETTVVNAFHNNLEESKTKFLLSDWSKNASLVDAFVVQAISDNKTDARLTQPYDKIEFSIPLTYLCKFGKLTVKNINNLNAVFYSDGMYTNAKMSVQGENVILETTASGDLIFFSGTPGKDGPGFSALNKTDDEVLNLDNSIDDDDEDKKTTYKKVIKRKKVKSNSSKIIWLIVCIVGALVILALGFLGYKKFIASSLSLFLVIGIAAIAPPDIFALEADAEEKVAEIRLVSDHPGIPGYDVKYEAIVYYGTEDDIERLDANEFTLSSTLKAVEIKGNTITLPSSVKDNTELDGFKIYVSVKKDKSVTAFYPVMIKKWSLEIEDNFNGDKINEDIWTLFPSTASQVPQDNGKYVQAYVSNDCIKVENGNMVMRILDGDDGVAYSKNEVIEADFLMPRINTKGKFEQQYGCFMSSMKMPYNTTAGSNSAFWLLPSTGNWGNTFLFDSPSTLEGFSCGEIDIIEYSPAWKNGKFQSAMHWWESTTLVKGTGMEKSTSYSKFTKGEYVNMACVWNENSLYIYYDGILQRQVKNLVASGEKAYVIYTIQTAGYGDNPSWTGAFTEADLPQMVCYVDYMKVFS